MTTTAHPARPEVIELTDKQRKKVGKLLHQADAACPHCKGDAFVIDNALYLGFLFLNEDTDVYIIALTCTNAECPAPRTGVKLRERDFL